MKALAGPIGMALFFLAIINFAAFAVIALSIGGDALNGKQENGHYYVSSHGKLTEVSRSVWLYSAAHSISLFVTHPLGFAGAGLAAWSNRKRSRSPHASA